MISMKGLSGLAMLLGLSASCAEMPGASLEAESMMVEDGVEDEEMPGASLKAEGVMAADGVKGKGKDKPDPRADVHLQYYLSMDFDLLDYVPDRKIKQLFLQ